MQTIRIDRRFRGPPSSGNGGYVAGLLGNAMGGVPCIVTLRMPPPLDRLLQLECDGTTASLIDGDALVASAVAGAVELVVPPSPTIEDAEAGEAGFTGFCHHIFPGCFVCGPERAVEDGLRIFPGRVDGPEDQVAALWRPDAGLADEDGHVRPEFLWAALDCPGYFAVEKRSGAAVLGRMGAVIHRAIRVGEPVIVTGWPIASDGRKHQVGTALHDGNGQLIAAALATWVSIPSPSSK